MFISRSTSKAVEKSDARRNWDSLGARLRTLVDMRRQWGNLHEMYETHVESMYELQPLPKWVRDPDSSFSAAWDLTSVALLLYVAITVPLRAGLRLTWNCGHLRFSLMYSSIYSLSSI